MTLGTLKLPAPCSGAFASAWSWVKFLCASSARKEVFADRGAIYCLDAQNGAVVWEYINSVTAGGVVKTIGDCLPMPNATLRAYRYPLSFAGFVGKDLTPGDTITQIAAKAWSMRALPDTGQPARSRGCSRPTAPTTSWR